ncbi:MAG: DNA topoisomerase, partial [Thermoanaerobaculia bacterium]
HTMSVAQRLYEGVELAGGERVGLITYMRTDSMTLAERALAEAERWIRGRFGDAYSDGPRRYRTAAKSAQEAHEAIRPTELGRTPEAVRRHLREDEFLLYDLIWKRTVASQMGDAKLSRTAVEIEAGGPATATGTFSATGTRIDFPGFLRVYVEGSDDPAADLGDQEALLPALAVGQTLAVSRVAASGHETQPAPRYTEASLIQRLEKEGIGRPSTYAAILDTIQRRGYVVKQRNALVPTWTAWAVTKLLEKHFGPYVDLRFTARMEEQLDEIAEGDLDWLTHLRAFYFGDDGVGEAGLERRIAEEEPKIDYPRLELGPHPEDGRPIFVRVGRYGAYLQHGVTEDEERRALSIPEGLAPAELTLDKAIELLAEAGDGERELGSDPASGEAVTLRRGRYGPYVQLGEAGAGGAKPRRASLPQGTGPAAVTLADALRWLSLPRILGADPATGEEVVATVGRFGPFVRRGEETRSLGQEDDVYAIELPRALELLAAPKTARRRRGRVVLRELGGEPGGKPVQLLDGPYGPYLSNGTVNAALPKGADPAALDLAAALAILAERGKEPKRRRQRSPH